jgi:U3 small nucleolar RNA-associated protein 11
MRNAVARRPHRERAQPAARSKWGLLEKHKDYSLRAQDYNTKKKKLAALTTKVRDRHPDEFAYGMIKNKQGKHGSGGDENRLSHEAVKLLKSQDAGYLRTVLARGRKEVRKVEEQMGLAKPKAGKKTVFEEDAAVEDEPRGKKRTADGDILEHVDINQVSHPDVTPVQDDEGVETHSVDENPSRSKPKTKKEVQQRHDAATRLRAERKRRKRLQEARTVKLEMLKKRQKEIMAAADQLDLQRAKMAKTVGGTNKNGVKFKVRERKR